MFFCQSAFIYRYLRSFWTRARRTFTNVPFVLNVIQDSFILYIFVLLFILREKNGKKVFRHYYVNPANHSLNVLRIMRGDFARYDNQFDTTTTAEEDSYISSEFDLLNSRSQFARRVLRKKKNVQLKFFGLPSRSLHRHQHPIVNKQISEAKLPTNKNSQITIPQDILNIESSPSCVCLKKLESQIIFEERYSSENERFNHKFKEEAWRLMHCANNRKGRSTPRIVRAIRRNSKKLDNTANRSLTIDRPRTSKSSVVVLYHGRSNTPPSSSSKALVHLAKSDQTIAEISQPTAASPTLSDKTKVIETPETLSPRYPLCRRRTASKRYRRASRPHLNVNIYPPANPVERIASPSRRHRAVFERRIEVNSKDKKFQCAAKHSADSGESRERIVACHKNEINRKSEKRIEERTWKRQCSPIEVAVSKPMDYHPKRAETDGVKQRRQSALCSSRAFPAQQTHIKEPGINSTFISVNEGDEANRVFPFQATPSGNLKIIPNQVKRVVFESKKFSVLVADPRHTKVNVKAEFSRSGVDVGPSVLGSSNRIRYIDLPPGVTPSTINQLQAQKKLPYIDANYRSRTQPSAKFHPSEMEQKQPASYQIPPLNEVPLSSLGFTNEEPIKWDSIILPEKTDLYQELARRITNYKNADCIVQIDQDEFYCHLLVLQSYSTFFDEKKNCKNINLSDSNVTAKAFSIIYDWMISPINESYQLLRRDNILDIFMAAQYLGIKELEEQCWAFIDNDELFSEDTAFLLYLEAKKIGNTAVMELMVPRIMKFFLVLVSTKDFLELSVDELCLLLKSNYISVNSEMEVLMSAVRWLMHDWSERKQYMLEVLKCVRFGLIAPWQLVDVKRNPENPEFMELMSYPEVQKMVDDGLAFVIIKYWYGNQTEDYYHWIDLLGLNEPTNRNWAGEDKNYVTYREFLLYLEEYQKTNIAELRTRKTRTRPTPPSSPPKDCSPLPPERTRTDSNQNYCCVDSYSLEQYSTTQSRVVPKRYVSKVATSPGMVIPPEILTECLSSMGRSNNIRTNKTQCDRNRNCKPIIHDAKYCGAGESPRRPSVDFLKNTKYTCEHQCEISTLIDKSKHEARHNISDIHSRKQWEQNVKLSAKKQQKMMKKSRYPANRTDSAKSEEEAATMIQATYRGYKVRRKFDEIKKSSSEEKQNVQKVAELLSMSQSGWPLQKSLNSVKASNSIANQNKNTLHHI
ncbi:uncharacterized protein LOC105284947 isoform X2 [Ooceraea biroi]|uniref:uncharacterized protein LOC105284947 isoform X2 n=2 Tax=Ooceraea biroi TaxID=2015173 RepID=UPI000F09843A|nr:uncharacterized protein LOC105284947 isoform X2 [Ooceraea biroi]